MPRFDLTLIPFIWTEDPDSSIVDLINDVFADPDGHEMLWAANTLLPIANLDVTAYEPVLTSTNNINALLRETEAIRVMGGGTGYYKGMMSGPIAGGAAGAAYRAGRSSFSQPDPLVVAHELGHNLSLYHPTCNYDGFHEPSYPYANGVIGAWGYDLRRDGSLVAPASRDLMGGCGRGTTWISDYNFSNALRFRLYDRRATQTAAESLLLWGGVGVDGALFLEPAFVVNAPAALPEPGGAFELSGRTEDGNELFSLAFDMRPAADGDGSSSFVFVLPAERSWEGNLATITLSGPAGWFTLDGDSDLPMAILRNGATGQVHGILRGVPPDVGTQAAMDTAGRVGGTALEVLLSRGIPARGAWRR